ncbi:MAG TPA: AAA family ATPase [Accumulibacter sp.]|nr:AAA family ATPase [Accumulibacter sp.]
MYLEHFGLNEAPFRITPHTDFFFDGAKRGATLDALIYAITHDEGIVKVSGEVGSGKTMLCRMLLEKLPPNVETVYLANPMLSRDEILRTLAEELRIPLDEVPSHQLLRTLQERLLEIYGAGRQVVVLIDEAHAMPPEALEEIRLLSNLESNRHKLLQIVLFGQPELDARLAESAMRQLNDRITHHFVLEPLPRDDVGVYLMFRLRAAGYRGPDLFTRRAIRSISQASEGLTRRINILADKALLAAFSEGCHQVDSKQVKAAINDSPFKRLTGGKFDRNWRMAGGLSALCLTAAAAYFVGSQSARQPADLRLGQTAPDERVANSPAVTRAPAPGEPSAAASITAPGASTPAAPTSPISASAGTTTHAEGATKISLLANRIATTDAWLQTVSDDHFVIQLLLADAGNQRQIADFIAGNDKLLDTSQIRVYRAATQGRDRLGVIYGDYATRQQAANELSKLSALRLSSQPYVRPVSQLR